MSLLMIIISFLDLRKMTNKIIDIKIKEGT